MREVSSSRHKEAFLIALVTLLMLTGHGARKTE
jgi:hypothetical protein